MSTLLWCLAVAILMDAVCVLRVRRARRNAYALAVEHARAAALSVAEGCQQGDGMDQYEIGRHSGAMDTFNAISGLLYVGPR